MVRATAEPVEGSKVRLTVDVDESEIDTVLAQAVKSLSSRARIPGFRPGHVPRQVLEARMGGAAALRAEALRDAIPDFYAQAVVDAEVDPIAPPEIDITAGEESGSLSFDAVVQVRPVVGIPGYQGLEVTVPSPEVTDQEVADQVDRLRDVEAELVQVERPAVDGDHVTMDFHGQGPDGDRLVDLDDTLYQVGSGRFVEELDAQLRGAKAGDILAFDADVPDGPQGASFRVLVKAVKEKKLPPLTDEWAAESSEFATVEELRQDLRRRMADVKRLQARMAVREGALGALVALVDEEEVPEVLVEEEVRQRVHDLSHRLEEQRVSIEQFLEATGRTGDELVAEVREQARRAVTVDLALRALAQAEEIEATDQDLEEEVAAMARQMEMEPEDLRRQIDRAGRTLAVRSERSKGKALQWLEEHVRVVDQEGNPVPAELLAQEEEDAGAGADLAGEGEVGEGEAGEVGAGDAGADEAGDSAESATGEQDVNAETQEEGR